MARRLGGKKDDDPIQELQLLQQLEQAYAEQESPDERYKFASVAIDDAIPNCKPVADCCCTAV